MEYQEELTSLFPNLHLEPGLRQSELISTILFVIKNELQVECTRSELFQISQTAFYLSFHITRMATDQNVDDLQTLARAICLQATRQVVANVSFPFPHLPTNVRQIIEQKCQEIRELNISNHRN